MKPLCDVFCYNSLMTHQSRLKNSLLTMSMFTSDQTFTTTPFCLQSGITMSFYRNLDPAGFQILSEREELHDTEQKLFPKTCAALVCVRRAHGKDPRFAHACINIRTRFDIAQHYLHTH